MKITVTTLSDEIFSLDVSDDLELENFKVFCEIESGIPSNEILINHNGKPLMENQMTLKALGIVDGDIVILQRMFNERTSRPPATQTRSPLANLDFANIQVPGTSGTTSSDVLNPMTSNPPNAEYLRNLLSSNPEQMSLLKQNNPRLADALTSGKDNEVLNILKEQMEERNRREEQRRKLLHSDPFDLEAQRLIAEEIKQKNIEANMNAAMEYHPEAYGSVTMLYINCKVNGYPVKAFIDSGAQNTFLSASCAERCNIMRLLDTRWTGIAKGLGVQYIIGRVHVVQMTIENDYLTTSFSVLQDQPMDMLLGLDMLRRHQCCIDLKRNVLRIGTTGTETPFLPESEISKITGELQEITDEELKEIKQAKQRLGVGSDTGAGSSSSAATTDSSSIQPTDPFKEELVVELVGLGFSRNDVISELRRFKGDKNQALAALFAKSLKF